MAAAVGDGGGNMTPVASTRGVVGGKGRAFGSECRKNDPCLISINTLLAQCAPNGCPARQLEAVLQLEAVMSYAFDMVQLACEIAEIASAIRDSETGRRLVNLADQLLTAAGLPLTGKQGAA